MRFEFNQHKKVIVWECTTFSIEADTYEEALKKAEQAKENDLFLCLDCMEEESETVFDNMETLPTEKNNGYSTIEVYDSNLKLLFENGKTNIGNY